MHTDKQTRVDTLFITKERQTDKQTAERERERERERQTDRQTDRQTEREREIVTAASVPPYGNRTFT